MPSRSKRGIEPAAGDGTRRAVPHGGDLADLAARFPDAPRPWIDLSTGINPWPYPVGELPAEVWTRLPQKRAETDAAGALGEYLGLEDELSVALAPGSQAAIQQLPFLIPPRTVDVVAPTYGEHAPAWRRAGHAVTRIDRAALPEAEGKVVVLTQPNNPDGAALPAENLRQLALRCRERGGLLIVDEAFADVHPEVSLTRQAPASGAVVLRSFGKFFGLAGLRAGAMIAGPELAGALRDRLGPWAVSGPALAVMARACRDFEWIRATRRRLDAAAGDLDRRLAGAGLAVVGGTSLFRLVETRRAGAVCEALGSHGIAVRAFADNPRWLRFGLPGTAEASDRLDAALATVARE